MNHAQSLESPRHLGRLANRVACMDCRLDTRPFQHDRPPHATPALVVLGPGGDGGMGAAATVMDRG